MAALLYQKAVVAVTIKVNAHECGKCGVVYGLSEEFERWRRQDGATFYCPNGHGRAFVESEVERLNAELKRSRERAESYRSWSERVEQDLATARKQHAVTKGQLTKVRKRIQAGVCPQCRRHFMNVERHMETQHSEPSLEA